MFLSLTPVHSHATQKNMEGQKETGGSSLTRRDWRPFCNNPALSISPKFYYPLLHKVKLKLSWDKHQHPHTASRPTWGQCKCLLFLLQEDCCVNFTLWLQPCNLYSERCCLWPPGFLCLAAICATVAREMQQTQLDVMSRWGWKAITSGRQEWNFN